MCESYRRIYCTSFDAKSHHCFLADRVSVIRRSATQGDYTGASKCDSSIFVEASEDFPYGLSSQSQPVLRKVKVTSKQPICTLLSYDLHMLCVVHMRTLGQAIS